MLRKLVSRRTLAVVSGSTAVIAGGGYYYLNSGPSYPPSTKETRRPPQPWTPPSRQQMLDALKASGEDPSQEFDLLIVGGGATGAGVAVDAASRGLKVALVERDDFSSGEWSALFQRALSYRLEKYRRERTFLHCVLGSERTASSAPFWKVAVSSVKIA